MPGKASKALWKWGWEGKAEGKGGFIKKLTLWAHGAQFLWGTAETCIHQFLDRAPSFKSITFPDILPAPHSWGLVTEEETTHNSCCQEYSLVGAHIVTHSSVTSRHIYSHIYTHSHMYTHTWNTIAYTLCSQRYTKAELHTPTCPYNCIHTLRHTKKLCTTTHMFICTHTHMYLPMHMIKCIHSYTHTITHACTGPHIHLWITQPQPLTHVPWMETRCLRTCYFHVLQQPPTHSEEERIFPPPQ